MEKQLRLDKILADTGKWSRKEARELIRRGSVCVNGAVLRQPDCKLKTEGLKLVVQGHEVLWTQYIYLMMNKPGGILTATEDRTQATVLDLLPPELQKRQLRPVGRLDKDTEGLLLLTDDGALNHRLISPRSHVDKIYYAETEGTVDAADREAFAAGMVLSDGLVCQSAGLEPLEEGKCLVTLREGKFHQVKRMLAERGKPVLYLSRIAMGGVILDETLEKGAYRPLKTAELALLRGNEATDSSNSTKKLKKTIEFVQRTRYNRCNSGKENVLFSNMRQKEGRETVCPTDCSKALSCK